MTELEISKVKAICSDLMEHNPFIYFLDFTLSAAIGYGAVYIYLSSPDYSLLQVAGFLVGGFALFRAGLFMHEIVHIPSGKMKGFKVYWTIFYGIPLLAPAFMYKCHKDHHARKYYGTSQDGEYQSFAKDGIFAIITYFAQVLFLPLFGIIRFLLVTPLSLVHPKVRLWVLRRLSSYVSNPKYVRRVPKGERHGLWILQELACFVVLAGLLYGLISGAIPLAMASEMYVLTVFTILLNWLRNLAGHRFLSDGTPMGYMQQFEESITIIGKSPLNDLLFPLGMRFHAIHHLFPALPYHNLAKAHRRLMTRLPDGSSYHQTQFSGLGSVFSLLLGNIKLHKKLVGKN